MRKSLINFKDKLYKNLIEKPRRKGLRKTLRGFKIRWGAKLSLMFYWRFYFLYARIFGDKDDEIYETDDDV